MFFYQPPRQLVEGLGGGVEGDALFVRQHYILYLLDFRGRTFHAEALDVDADVVGGAHRHLFLGVAQEAVGMG